MCCVHIYSYIYTAIYAAYIYIPSRHTLYICCGCTIAGAEAPFPRRCSLRLSGAELRSLWEQMAAEQAAEEAQERERMKRLAAELLEFNQLKQMEMSEKSRRER